MTVPEDFFPTDLPRTLVPHRRMVQLNESVSLDGGDVTIHLGEEAIDAQAKILFSWNPYPCTLIQAHADNVRPGMELVIRDWGSKALILTLRDQQFEAILAGFHSSYESPTSCSMKFELKVPSFDRESEPMKSVRFCLTNLDPFLGEMVRTSSGMSANRLNLSHGGWRVVIDGVEMLDDLTEQRRFTQGHVITHAGTIEKTDGSLFPASEALEMLSLLLHLFCLVQGNWAPYIFPEGLNEKEEVVWEHWYVPKGDHWSSPTTWFFKVTDTRGWNDMFAHLVDHWEDRKWKRAFQNAVYWYNLVIIGKAPNATLVMAQNALEVLAWYHFVTLRGRSEKKFDGKKAARRIELLLEAHSIPSDIPLQLVDLASFGAQQDPVWKSGPQCTAGLRNLDCHPKDEEVPDEVVLQGSKLSLWHLELCLLAMAGYKGAYWNRMRASEAQPLEHVPW